MNTNTTTQLTQWFTVTANGTHLGEYEARSQEEACDLCAQDAGYESVADMEYRLDEVSDLVAEATFAHF